MVAFRRREFFRITQMRRTYDRAEGKFLINIAYETAAPEPKDKVFIPMYKPLKTEKCEKCGKVIAEPKELIRITKVDV